MIGGELLGQGSYGCVFKPILPCTRKKIPKDAVGKIFSDYYDFAEELKIARKIQQIDPDGAFTAQFLGQCKTNLLNTSESEDIFSCEHIADKHQLKDQLMYKNAGKSLFDIVKHVDIDDFVPAMFNMFQGLQKLQAKNLCHLDIKPDNVMFDPNTKRMYLVDFGLMTTLNTVINDTPKMRYNYLYYPPEFKVLGYASMASAQPDTKAYIKEKVEQNFSLIPLHDFYKLVPAFEHDLVKFIGRTSKLNEKQLRVELKKNVKKIDTYSLAMSFMECWYLHESVRDEKMVAGFIQYIIIPALHPDPNERIDLEKILSRYQKFLEYWKLTPPITLGSLKTKRLPTGATVPGYTKDFSRCKRTEKDGGYSISALRALAKTYGIVATKRKDICDELAKHAEK